MHTDCSTAGRIADLMPTEDNERENAVLPEVSEDGHVSEYNEDSSNSESIVVEDRTVQHQQNKELNFLR